MFSSYNGIKLETNKIKIRGKFPSSSIWNNTFLNNTWVRKEVSGEIRKYLNWMKMNIWHIKICGMHIKQLGFPCGSDGKEYTCNVGDLGSVPRSGRSPGEGNGNPLQYSCLENSMDRGAWQATVHWVAKYQTWLSN